MKKPILVPLSEKKDLQILQDMARTPQERIEYMFKLNEAMFRLQKDFVRVNKPNSIVLKRKAHG